MKFKWTQAIPVLVSVMLGISVIAYAQSINWVTANEKTFGWDAVTTKSDGTPLGETDQVKYNVFLANAITDPGKSNPALVADSISKTAQTVTLNTEGKFFVGVQAERWVNEGTADAPDYILASSSEVVWSDDPTYVTDGVPFGWRYYLPPANPGGLR